MLLVLFALSLLYFVLLKKNSHILVYSLILIMGLENLPSAIGEIFVLHLGATLLKPQDVLLLVTAIFLITDYRAIKYIRNNALVALIIFSYISLNIAIFLKALVVSDLEIFFLRSSLFGALSLVFCLIHINVSKSAKTRRTLGNVFTIFNIITAIGALSVIYWPELNAPESQLYTSIGWKTGAGVGSIVLVSVYSIDVALISLYYFLVIERKKLSSPIVILPIILIVAGSHRITYLAAAILIIYTLFFLGIIHKKKKTRKRAIVSIVIFLVILPSAFLLLGNNDRFARLISPFFNRAVSIADINDRTSRDRIDQYEYFIDGYLSNQRTNIYLLGQAYQPTHLRDSFYQKVSPHNFVIHTIVERGIVGSMIILALLAAVLFRVRKFGGSPFTGMILLFLFTQLTDAGFSVYPMSAIFSLLLALSLSNTRDTIGPFRRASSIPIAPGETSSAFEMK